MTRELSSLSSPPIHHFLTHLAASGAVAVAGLGISWLRDNLCMIESPEQASELAASVPDTGGVYFVPAFSGLLAPRWEDSARGAIVGLTGLTEFSQWV